MDLREFHQDIAGANYYWKDRLNSITGRIDCRFLEWTGWYSQDLYQRFLGHYRLYQIFKLENSQADNIESISAFIIHYRSSHFLKYFFSRLISVLYYLGTFGKVYYPCQIEGINNLMVNEHSGVLHEFLSLADDNFEQALTLAVGQITSPRFYNKAEIQLQAHNTKGKEKGVFSKKQLLIFFDLFAESKSVEKIDYTRLNKFENIAEMLQAISGKGKDSFIEQLRDCRSNGLYEFHNKGELNQLIITITNLSDIFRKAGFLSIAKTANKKLRELDNIKKDHYPDN